MVSVPTPDSSTTINILQAALAWSRAGFSVIPIRADGTKRPAVEWKQYMAFPASEQQITSWFGTHPEFGLGIVCGAASGNLEMLELEGRAADSVHLDALIEQMDREHLSDAWRSLQGAYSEWTPSGGIHILYRIGDAPVGGNQKIAISADNLCLSETRGEGGYVIVAPSGGTVHATGDAWTPIMGSPSSVPAIPVALRNQIITAIHDAIDERPAPPVIPAPLPSTYDSTRDGQRPGDEFNAKTPWQDILIPAGWQFHHQVGRQIFWVRPGKNPVDGHSATTGRRDDEQDCLYVFSSSTGLPSEEPLTKLYVYAHYQYHGNLSEAAKHLAAQGFGDRPAAPATPLSWAGVEVRPNPHSAATPALSTPETPVADVDGFEETKRLRVTPASAFNIRHVRWLWENRAPIGEMTLVPGREGVGKSLLLTSLAALITRGLLPGEFFGIPRSVLWCASEDSWAHTLAPRMVAAEADLDRIFRLDVNPLAGVGSGAPVLPRDCHQMRDIAREVDAACLMLDPVISMIDGALDSYKAPELRKALEPLRDAAEQAEIGILALAHFNKTTTGDVSSRVAGSRAWLEVARAAMSLARLPHDEDDEDQHEDSDTALNGQRRNLVVLSQEKSNLGRTDLPDLMYEILPADVPTFDGNVAHVAKIVWCGNSPMSAAEAMSDSRASQKGGNMKEIVAFVTGVYASAGLNIAAREVVEYFAAKPYELTPANIRMSLSRAVKSGLIISPSRGMYAPGSKNVRSNTPG